jgi:hypothetical protein
MTRDELNKIQQTIQNQRREKRNEQRKHPGYNPVCIWLSHEDTRTFDEVLGSLDPEARAQARERGVEVIGWSNVPVAYDTPYKSTDGFASAAGEVREYPATGEQARERERIDAAAAKLRDERASRPRGFDQRWLDYSKMYPPGSKH